MFVEIHYDELAHVFSYLDKGDLYKLALTCRRMRDVVYRFCTTSKQEPEMKMRKFLHDCKRLLSSNEITLVNEMDAPNVSPLWLWKKSLLYSNRRRVSCLPGYGVNFSHFSNCCGLFQEDSEVKRDVLDLDYTHFPLQVKYAFEKVGRGMYKLLIRIKFWPLNEHRHFIKTSKETIFRLWWTNKNGVEQCRSATFTVTKWSDVMARLSETSCYYGQYTNCMFADFKPESGWLNLILEEPIALDSVINVIFHFLETDHMFWKCNMVWDFIELVPVDAKVS